MCCRINQINDGLGELLSYPGGGDDADVTAIGNSDDIWDYVENAMLPLLWAASCSQGCTNSAAKNYDPNGALSTDSAKLNADSGAGSCTDGYGACLDDGTCTLCEPGSHSQFAQPLTGGAYFVVHVCIHVADCFGLLAAPFDGKKGNIINPNQHLPKEGAAQERECIPGLEFVTVAASVEIGTVQRDEEGRDMGPMTEEQFIGAVSAFCHCT